MKNAVWVILLAVVTGCAVNPRSENMVSDSIQVTNRSDDIVFVTSNGGKESNDEPLLRRSSLVSNENFVKAVMLGIEKHGIFSQAIEGARPGGSAQGYQLDIAILDISQPARGFDMTVTMTTRWTLTNLSSGQTVFEEFVDTSYTAVLGAAFAGWKRLRLATEGVARVNIEEGLTKLSSFPL